MCPLLWRPHAIGGFPTQSSLTVRVEARVAPRVDRVDLHVETDNPARDHRVRLLFPTGAPVESFLAATTFDVATRTNVPPPATGWWHVPPDTFPHQGWVSANGLTVGAPGLPEAEVTEEGVIAVTLLRAVGWLSHLELRRRPIPAGPTLVAPDAQCPDGIGADLTIRARPRRTPRPRSDRGEGGRRRARASSRPGRDRAIAPRRNRAGAPRTGVRCPLRAEARRGRRRDDPSTPQSHRRRSRCHGRPRSALRAGFGSSRRDPRRPVVRTARVAALDHHRPSRAPDRATTAGGLRGASSGHLAGRDVQDVRGDPERRGVRAPTCRIAGPAVRSHLNHCRPLG